jgi:hypothetical protein
MKRAQSAVASALVCAAGVIACGRVPLDLQPPADPPPPTQPCDQDGDGHLAGSCGGDDCNDGDPAIHPAAPDLNAVPGPWTTSRVLTRPGGTDSGTAIAADRSGGVHIAYAAGRSLGLLYARRAGRGWQVEPVGSPDDPQPDLAGFPWQRQPAIAVDARGSVHIIYSTPAGIRHAVRTGAVWTTERVDPAGHGTSAIAIAPGAIHVAYGANDGLRHAARGDRAWTIDLVDPLGMSPSIAVDAAGTVHLAYGNNVEGAEVLRYATGTAGAWRVETASSIPAIAGSVAVGRDGLPRIAFGSYSIAGRAVNILTRAGSVWVPARIPTTDYVYSATLRLDGRDRPTVLYSQVSDVFFAALAADGWRSERDVVLGQSDLVPAFDLDAAGTAHVASTGFFYPDNYTVDYSSNRQLALDGVDHNCDGVDGVDADRDGHASLATGGDDCDDDDPSSAGSAADGSPDPCAAPAPSP